MAPKRKMGLLTLLGSNAIPIPIDRHTWPKHPSAHDSFWKRVVGDSILANPPFEYVDLESTANETP